MIVPPVPGTIQNKDIRPEVIERPKSSGWRRIKEVFIAEDLGTVKGKVFEGVVVPSIKDFIVNIVTNTITMIFYGERAVTSSTKKLTSSFLSGSGNRISYSSYWASGLSDSANAKSKLAPNMITNYAEPLFGSKEEAKDALADLVEMMDNYEQVTVSDLYSLEQVSRNGYQNQAVFEKWGWKNLGNAHVELTPNGFTLNLPRPKYLGD